jgi:hypothetical protein
MLNSLAEENEDVSPTDLNSGNTIFQHCWTVKLQWTRYASKHVLAIFEFDKDLSFIIYKSGVQPYTSPRTKFRRNNSSQKKRIMLDQPVTVLVYNGDGDSAKVPYDFIWEKGMEMTA